MREWFRDMQRAARRLTAGFTLVELMVAITGGLFVTIAVFMLAKQATAVYTAEARMGNATIGAVAGFERLRLDIERAGFLVTPNIQRDPNRCGDPVGNAPSWPTYLQRLQAVFIYQPAVAPTSVLTNNHILPNEITLAGSYASSDQFPTGPVFDTSPVTIQLQTASPPMARLGYAAAGSPSAQAALLSTVFGANRILRVVDTAGKEQYGKIQSVTGGDTPSITLTIDGKPPFIFRSSATGVSLKCGVPGTGERSLVNVVNLIKYSVKDMTTNAAYAPLFASPVVASQATGATTDVGRTELVRGELDANGNTIDGSEEIVAEFAVDLAFGISYATVRAGDGGSVDSLGTIGPNSPAVSTWAGAPPWPTGQGPQLLRVVRARLSIRSRAADRLSNIPTIGDGGLPIASGLYRVGLGANGGSPFARVRTVQADIMIRNLSGVTWL